MGSIKGVKARQVFDSRGNPTIEVDVKTEDGEVQSAHQDRRRTHKLGTKDNLCR